MWIRQLLEGWSRQGVISRCDMILRCTCMSIRLYVGTDYVGSSIIISALLGLRVKFEYGFVQKAASV
jgi:hypothetical protein